MNRTGAYNRYAAYRRRRRNGHGAPRWLIALIIVGGLSAIAFGVLGGVGYGLYRSYTDDLVTPAEEIARLPLGGAEIRDRNGVFLYEFFDDATGLRKYVPADQISLNLIAATIAAEDASFMDNPGVNYRGLAAAAFANFSPIGDTPGFLEGRGGSSITQQLVKNIYFTPDERIKRSVTRKMKETAIALELTRTYSKEQILEWYLNLISYGNVFIGAEAASNGYFDKSAKDLTLAEAATLAAIPSCPVCFDPINEPEATVRQRNEVLRRMHDEGYITRDLLLETLALPLVVSLQPFPVSAPHFVFNVVKPELERLFGAETLRRDGLIVFTSIDLDLQHQAEAILEEWITTFEDSGGHNGAVVAIDPKTAEILAYVGSRDYFREDIDGQNDMADALNSPGSAFKPFTYLTSFIERGFGPGTMILDTPFPAEFWDGDRLPRNPGTGFQGPISLRNSLGSSLNIPAVKTIMYAGVQNVIDQATKMGITGLDPSRLGPALTVGGVDVKLSDMVYAYTAFPNLGILKGVETTQARAPGERNIEPVSILRVENSDGEVIYPLIDGVPSADGPYLQEQRVSPAAETYLINSILSDGCAQTITFGACGALSIAGRPIGIKTGTSEPYANSFGIGDTWAIGYTPQLVVGSWFGNADNSPMTGITSTSVSWRTVRDFLVVAHEGLPVEQFIRPPGLVEAETCVASGLKPTDACPMTTPPDLFVAESLPEAEDNWWTLVRIDTRTGLLAGPLTPDEFVEEQTFLQLPEGLSAWERNQALEWADKLETSTDEPPTDVTTASDLPIAIDAPIRGEQIFGLVDISGRASSDDFAGYRLEYRFETIPGDWIVFAEGSAPIEDGVLATWDTTVLPLGLYTVRLVMDDERLGESSTRVQVLVVSAIPPTPTGLPPATPDGPDPGEDP
ncbi:MAG: transglycosylase domain-containing protein [Chloroflexi bacterium]|nr:transglycosylase domain-containing protein [Chloroflexota bacterium]